MEEIISISRNVDGTEIVITKCLMLEDISYSLSKILDENWHLDNFVFKCEHYDNKNLVCCDKNGICKGFYVSGNSEEIIKKLERK
jgi:hypothetical protein